MAIKDWPKGEGPREKLLLKGASALSDAELLAIFLRTGVKGKSAVDLARELLDNFGGLRSLLGANHKKFCQVKGLGDAKYIHLQATIEIARRYLYEPLKRESVLTSPETTRMFLQSKLQSYPYEVFACLFLDNKHRVIAFEEMFRGTIDHTGVHPREVVKRALDHHAAAMIVAHNHPSGVAEVSDADKRITDKLKKALALMEVRLLDHFIIGDQVCLSFVEQGLL